jgi:hypothetical protein
MVVMKFHSDCKLHTDVCDHLRCALYFLKDEPSDYLSTKNPFKLKSELATELQNCKATGGPGFNETASSRVK